MTSGSVTNRPRNWAGNIVFSTDVVHRPQTVAQLQEIVAGSTRIRALGTGHSFNEIADSESALVSVAGLPTIVEIASDRSEVRVSGGTRWGELATVLQAAGHAIPNTGSLPHISVAGAAATGTHGSGNRIGNLATFVSAVEMVTADGDLVEISRESHPDSFDGVVVSLGTLGIVTTLTLDIVPTFSIRQDVYDDLPHEQFLTDVDDVMAAGYSVSAFSSWRTPRIQQIWVKSVTESTDRAPAPIRFGLSAATGDRHPVAGMPVGNATAQRGVPGPWNERLPHFRLEFTPSAGDEIQSEYLLPREHAAAALTALDDIATDIAHILQVAEIRTIAADTLWLSPSHGRDTVGLHFTWIGDERAVAPVVAAIEPRLAAYDARPHWGKRFNVGAAEIARLYPRMDDFRSLMQDFDPAGRFRNGMIDRIILG